MGTLLNAFGSVGGAVQGSTGLGILSTALNASGQITAGIGQNQQYNYMAQVARNNSAIELANSSAAMAAGSVAESQYKTKVGLTIAEQKTAQAANGLDVNIGTPVAVRESTARVGAIDEAMIHYNASRQAFGYEAQAANDTAQASVDSTAAKNAIFKGLYGASSTVLGGLTSFAQKKAQYALSGAA